MKQAIIELIINSTIGVRSIILAESSSARPPPTLIIFPPFWSLSFVAFFMTLGSKLPHLNWALHASTQSCVLQSFTHSCWDPWHLKKGTGNVTSVSFGALLPVQTHSHSMDLGSQLFLTVFLSHISVQVARWLLQIVCRWEAGCLVKSKARVNVMSVSSKIFISKTKDPDFKVSQRDGFGLVSFLFQIMMTFCNTDVKDFYQAWLCSSRDELMLVYLDGVLPEHGSRGQAWHSPLVILHSL